MQYNGPMANGYSVKYPYTTDELFDLYVTQGLSQRQIGQRFGLDQRTVHKHMKKAGIPARPACGRSASGPDHNSWKGGRNLVAKRALRGAVEKSGYWYVWAPDHPNASGQYVAEHIKVALEAAGMTELPKGQCVHHVDLDKQNNDPANLAIATRAQHAQWHAQLETVAVLLMKEGRLGFSAERGYFLT
jgi:hypothetical protein